MKAALKSNINPINAPTPIQYQYAYGKNPQDIITSIPIDFVEFGRTFSRKTGSDVKQLLRDFEEKKKVYNDQFNKLHVSNSSQETR